MSQYFYDLEDFPKLKELAQHWEVMRDEYLALKPDLTPIDRVGKPHDEVLREILGYVGAGNEYGWLKGWGGGVNEDEENLDWTQYMLMFYDIPLEFAGAPKTRELLGQVGGIKTVGFIRLNPGHTLPVHDHPDIRAEGLLQMQIGLDGPDEGAEIWVAGESRVTKPGCAWVLDGYYPHTAWNKSDKVRTILYMEFLKEALYKPESA